MTQKDRELLLKDLCGRLNYGVKVEVSKDELQNYDNYWDRWSFNEGTQEIDGVCIYGVTLECMELSDGVIPFEFIKPYLFPLSRIYDNEELGKEFDGLIELELKAINDEIAPTQTTEFEVDFYNKHHIDWRGLIPMGLANDATNLNIY